MAQEHPEGVTLHVAVARRLVGSCKFIEMGRTTRSYADSVLASAKDTAIV